MNREVRRTENRWDTPRKRALFGSDGPVSMSSGDDVTEGQQWWHPDGGYPMVDHSELPYGNDFLEESWSPSRELEDAVARLQEDIAEYQKELRHIGVKGPASLSQTTRQSGFTSTLVPRYSGKSSWEQYRQVFEAIACSNGWDDVTVALQLVTHLDGDALNVALLFPESQRVLSGVLMKSLSEHYGSPGRLAEYEPQFKRAFRRPGDDLSVLAIELETLARRVFADIDSSIQLQMVQDRFIAGQAECTLRRHLDSLWPDTPMRDIVDSCRVWESDTEAANSWNGGSVPKSPWAIYQVAVCVGNGALDLVGLRVGPSCLRMDSEETLPALQDERSVLSVLDLDATWTVDLWRGCLFWKR